MTYDEAFEQSKYFIKRLQKLIYASEWYNLVEPCDFEQECKIKFYMGVCENSNEVADEELDRIESVVKDLASI